MIADLIGTQLLDGHDAVAPREPAVRDPARAFVAEPRPRGRDEDERVRLLGDDPLEHQQPGAHGPLRLVLVRVLASPERHHAVAEVLQDTTVVVDDDPAELAPEPIHESADPLGVELLDDRRVALHVGEQDRDLPPSRALGRGQLGQTLPHRPERRLDDCVSELRPPLLERADCLLEPFGFAALSGLAHTVSLGGFREPA